MAGVALWYVTTHSFVRCRHCQAQGLWGCMGKVSLSLPWSGFGKGERFWWVARYLSGTHLSPATAVLNQFQPWTQWHVKWGKEGLVWLCSMLNLRECWRRSESWEPHCHSSVDESMDNQGGWLSSKVCSQSPTWAAGENVTKAYLSPPNSVWKCFLFPI